MTKFSLEILAAMTANEANVPSKSMTIPQIIECIPEAKRKTYGTVYRQLLKMCELGYTERALDDGSTSTYYITDNGTRYYKSTL